MIEDTQHQLHLARFSGWVIRQQSQVITEMMEENRVLKVYSPDALPPVGDLPKPSCFCFPAVDRGTVAGAGNGREMV